MKWTFAKLYGYIEMEIESRRLIFWCLGSCSKHKKHHTGNFQISLRKVDLKVLRLKLFLECEDSLLIWNAFSRNNSLCCIERSECNMYISNNHLVYMILNISWTAKCIGNSGTSMYMYRRTFEQYLNIDIHCNIIFSQQLSIRNLN